ncbi:MAG: polyphosphate kinase 1, partial [Bdellovibrionales bacterium]|nr:polyphosphate kinase 1 [Bdellovibrionales bacterium]
GLQETDIYTRAGLLDYRSLNILQKLPLHDCKLEEWHPISSPLLAEESSLFSVLKYKDLLFHHPYESFQDSTLRFLREATEDSKVRSIKLTLYRVGDHSPIVPLLVQAAEWGIEVVCMVELQARFDEERNIQWAHTLEEAGVHVVYGIPGLKTHAKVLLVVREEGEQLRTYAHMSTGNYNHFTATLYTDFGYMTAKPHITEQLHHFFNYVTGRSLKHDYAPLLIAPMNMKKRFLELIEHEIVIACAGEPAEIVAKMNGLDDEDLIESLYNASSHGVRVTLIVRGLCRLRPQVPSLSENIEVISILDRFLEHSRVYFFRHGAQDESDGLVYIGSADWMRRNLHRRVELIVPLEDRSLKEKALLELAACRQDCKQAWVLQQNGNYVRKIGKVASKALSAQEYIMNQTLEELHGEHQF